ncbi:hypothetical protein [Nocardia arthritidis]|uniref:Uncharacterized protein n=1 Tax=Nocardia arthritidis TaxID=228602 RepID=A0A6G9Y561_9NOCA|nr:hypothetical protein [Nocardia arthritidis]QIS08206.1 hypothetical protein F5544_01415 [Nocardia arthritidis]
MAADRPAARLLAQIFAAGYTIDDFIARLRAEVFESDAGIVTETRPKGKHHYR